MEQEYAKPTPPGNAFANGLLSNSVMELARMWLDDCRTHHRFCHRSLGGEDFAIPDKLPTLPTRVIDLAGNASPKLLETKGTCGSFAALSYRQGPSTKNFLSLTEDNKQTFIDKEQPLPVDQLGRTIIDAIQVARQLRLPYLWVDVLCIIQDNDADFEREIASMAQTYQSATVTIAVLGDRDSATGFSDTSTCAPSFPTPYFERAEHGLNSETDGPPVEGPSKWEDLGVKARLEREVSKSNWNGRAWTFQERLLSRRLLYFGVAELFWECHMSVRSRYGYDDYFADNPISLDQAPLPLFWTLSRQAGFYRCLADCIESGNIDTSEFRYRAKIPLSVFRSSLVYNVETFVRKHLAIDVPGDTVSVPSLLADYTRRKLAFPSDKLAAFEGLAGVVAKRTTQNCVAGIMTAHLAKALFWCSADGCTKPTTPRIAPSWSWAAQDCPIRGFEIDPHTEPESSDEYFRISRDGNFDGRLKHVSFRQSNLTLEPGRGVRPATLHADALYLPCFRSSRTCAVYPELIAELENRVRIWPRWYNKWPSDSCHFMHINEQRVNSSESGINDTHEQASGRSTLLTEKIIGIAYFDNADNFPSNFEAIILWTSREPVSAVRDIIDKDRSGERKLPLAFILRFGMFGMRTRRYFLLLVEPLSNGSYKRIGTGIGFYLKDPERIYGADICKLANRKSIVLV